jgi:hypothetical protein
VSAVAASPTHTLVQGRWPLVAPPAAAQLSPAAPPSLSVIVAAYQAAAVVGDALRSALDQTAPPRDVVVCDDGSTDDLAAALAPFADRVVVLRQDNAGEAAAKNAAARAASGDYVVILDADDLFAHERLEAIAACLAERPDLDIVTTDAVIEVEGRPARRVYEHGFAFAATDQRRAILTGNFVFGLAAVRRSRLLDAGGFDESIRFATDWDCWLRLILGGSAAGCIDAPLATYRLQRGSLSSQRARMLAGRVRTLEKARESLPLEQQERRVADAALRDYRRRLARALAHEALMAGEPGARRLSARAAAAAGQSLRSRVKFAAAALAPDAARRELRRRPIETTAGLLLEPGAGAAAPTSPAAAPR